MKKKIYCFNNGGSPGWYSAMAMAEDGNVLAMHCCSDECYMVHDLGITSTWKHENYNKHFGANNWELEWVSNPKRHAGLQAAYKLNQKLKLEIDEDITPKITVNFDDGTTVTKHL